MTRKQEELLYFISEQHLRMLTLKRFEEDEIEDLEYLIAKQYVTKSFPYNTHFFIVFLSEKGEDKLRELKRL